MARLAPALALAVALLLAGCITPDDLAPASRDLPEVPGDEAEALERRLTASDASASEVHIEADPADPEHLVAAANSEGGFDVYVSWDAGATWNRTHVSPGEVADATGRAAFAGLSDPVLAFGPDGTVYLSGLAYVPTSTVFVARSPDGGTSWPEASIVHESDPALRFNDKEWMAASPATGTLLVAWQMEPAMDQGRNLEFLPGVDPDPGNIVVSRSTDGGESWSDPLQVDRGTHNNGTQVVFGPDGQAHLLWVNYPRQTLDYVTSHDDGRTWTDPTAVAGDVEPVPPFDRYERMHTLPGLAVGPGGETLAAVWHDARRGEADVWAVASADGGDIWTDETLVTGGEDRGAVPQVYPWVAVDPDGRVHASWYDASPDPDVPLLDYRHAAAPGPGLDFGEPEPASTEAFQAFSTPETDEDTHRSLGDYTGLAASEAGVFPAWADGRGDAARVFAARLPAPGP